MQPQMLADTAKESDSADCSSAQPEGFPGGDSSTSWRRIAFTLETALGVVAGMTRAVMWSAVAAGVDAIGAFLKGVM